MNQRGFANIVSLGSKCIVAQELELLGLRNFSSPFDWQYTDLKGAIKCLDDDFIDFTNYSYFRRQSVFDQPNAWYNAKYDNCFLHDFKTDNLSSAEAQNSKRKLERRASKLIEETQSCPTLFIRIVMENRYPNEIQYISENIDTIYATIRGLNPANQIIFIATHKIPNEKAITFVVDEKSLWERPLRQNKMLYLFLRRTKYPRRKENLSFYFSKKKTALSLGHYYAYRLYYAAKTAVHLLDFLPRRRRLYKQAESIIFG